MQKLLGNFDFIQLMLVECLPNDLIGNNLVEKM